MKVIRHTEDQLILANTPWVISIGLALFILVFVGASLLRMSEDLFQGLLMLLGCLAFGAILLIAFVRKTQLILDKTTDDVILRRRSLLGYREYTFALHDLACAKVQSSRHGNSGSSTLRAALTFRSGPSKGTHPITIVYTSGKGPARAVETINNWLDNDASETLR